MQNRDLEENDFTLQEIIALKNIARQANEVRPIRHGRVIVPIIAIFSGLIFLAISIGIFIIMFYIDEPLEDNAKYGFAGISIFLFLISIVVLFKGFRNMLGKGKAVITLTPEGFILPRGNKFIPWNLLVNLNMTTFSFMSHIIEFKIAKTLEDKQRFLEKKPKITGTLFDKSIYRVAVTALGFEGLSSGKMMRLMETYIEADAARKQLDALNIIYN
ncbi:hypothetical protein [Bartonella sp. HY038]|uniref:hypothetical protein n=1 Tax=Bartonella sp. HY038 TaxID=2759660 RepID=UPI0015FBBD1C|nr:hypothetical protein [Bartonella sp. HY038]